MWAALRSRATLLPLSSPASSPTLQPWNLAFLGFNHSLNSSIVGLNNNSNKGLLNLQEVEKVLSDVKADNVKVIPVGQHFVWTDFTVIATGRYTWHVKNIAQALIYKAGTVIVHALDEKARDYYNLENLWTTEMSPNEPNQDLEKAFVKIRRKNNSKKPAQRSA